MRMTHGLAIVGLVSALACARDQPRGAANNDSIRVTAPAPARAPSFAERIPDSVLTRRGACPFECCQYTDWAVSTAADVRAAPQRDAPLLFTLPANQRFHADSGFVRITGKQLVAVADTITAGPAGLLHAGDTLLILDHIGEGHFYVWNGREVKEAEGFWGAEAPRRVSELIGDYAREWWVHVSASGGTGWLLVELPMRLIGADKCGPPPPWQREQRTASISCNLQASKGT